MHGTMRATAFALVLVALTMSLTVMAIGCAAPVPPRPPDEPAGDPGSPGAPGEEPPTSSVTQRRLAPASASSSDEIYETMGSLIGGLTTFKETASRADFFLHADAIDDVLEQAVEGLQDMEPQMFDDGLTEIARFLDAALALLEDGGLPDEVYEFIRLIEPRHVDQLVRIVDLVREIVDQGVQQVGQYRRTQTLLLLDEVSGELDRLGSKTKLRILLRIVAKRAPAVVVEELDRLGVGETLGPAVTALGQLLDEVAQFIEAAVL